jgi:cob(I)alamin adenosyltransferase
MPDSFKPRLGSGDEGRTDLPRGKRVNKTCARIGALAQLDELGALLGFARAKLSGTKRAAELHGLQRTLLKAAAQAAGLDFQAALDEETACLGERITALAAGRKPAKLFVLPGRDETEALLHLARTKARVCELALWKISARPAARYLNRLSDYLFLLAGEK